MRTAQVFVPDCIVRASVFERVKSDIKLIISVHVWILLYLSLSGFIRSAIKQSWAALIRRKSLTCYKILLDTWGHSTRSHCWRAIAGGQIHNVLLDECRQELRLFFTLKTVVCCLSHSRTAYWLYGCGCDVVTLFTQHHRNSYYTYCSVSCDLGSVLLARKRKSNVIRLTFHSRPKMTLFRHVYDDETFGMITFMRCIHIYI